jgi:hypothetical protein
LVQDIQRRYLPVRTVMGLLHVGLLDGLHLANID